MWSICLREGNVSPENLAKGPESAIGQVRQYRGKFRQMVPDNMSCVSVVFGGGVSVRTTPTDEGWERAEKELRKTKRLARGS